MTDFKIEVGVILSATLTDQGNGFAIGHPITGLFQKRLIAVSYTHLTLPTNREV